MVGELVSCGECKDRMLKISNDKTAMMLAGANKELTSFLNPLKY